MSHYVRFEANCDEIELYFDYNYDSPETSDSEAWKQLKKHFERIYKIKINIDFLKSLFEMNEPDEVYECDDCGEDILLSESIAKRNMFLCKQCNLLY